MNRNYLYLFIANFVIMALEILGIKLFAPKFGNSIYLTTAQIFIFFLCISIGYLFSDNEKLKHSVSIAIICLIVGLIGYQFLRQIHVYDMLIQAMLYSFLVFGTPVIFIVCPIPRIMKSCPTQIKQMLIASTLGGLLGLILPLFLIPMLGIIASISVIIAIFSLTNLSSIPYKKISVIIIIICLVLLNSNVFASDEPFLKDKFETNYGSYKIFQKGDLIYMQTEDMNAYQSIYNQKGNTGTIFDQMKMLPTYNNAKDILILGMGGGALVKYYQDLYNYSTITAVDIDSRLCEVATEHFGVSSHNFKCVIDDGRNFITTTDNKYDLIVIDMYNSLNIPETLSTEEFANLLKPHIREKGLIAINILKGNNEVVDIVHATFQSLGNAKFIENDYNMLLIYGDAELPDYVPKTIFPIMTDNKNNLAKINFEVNKLFVEQ